LTELQAKLKAADVKLVSFGVAPIPTDEPAARTQFEWAKKLGIEVLVTETKPNAVIDKLANEFGIKVAIHNHPSTWPPEQVLTATEGMSPMVGSCSDVGHWKRAKRDTVESLKLLGSRVIHSHFKDLGPTANGKGLKDVPWGTGQSDAAGMLKQLKSQGFKGYLIIEYENGTVDELMQNIPKCIEFFNHKSAELAK
jgi:sugar phosphate isomerase/epimerase